MLSEKKIQRLVEFGGTRVISENGDKIFFREGYIDILSGEVHANDAALENILNPQGLDAEKLAGWTDADDQKLKTLLANYQELLRDAVGYSGLIISDKTITFLGLDPDNDAHRIFVGYLMQGARKAKRILRKNVETDNPRFALRTFLVRLGWIGPDAHAERKEIYQKLPGSAAFRFESTREAWKKRWA